MPRDIIVIMRIGLPIIVSALFWLAVPASADYTLILKNGRRITAQSYREEGSMVKIQGLGGELGIPKDQIQTIMKAGSTDQQGLSISNLEAAAPRTPSSSPTAPPVASEDSREVIGSEPQKAMVNSDEEKQYQKRLAETTQKLETAKERYFAASQGGSTSASATKEGYKALTADLMSRLKDRRGAADSEFEPQEKELSDLRVEIDTLQKERDALIQEMKAKNYPTSTSR